MVFWYFLFFLCLLEGFIVKWYVVVIGSFEEMFKFWCFRSSIFFKRSVVVFKNNDNIKGERVENYIFGGGFV